MPSLNADFEELLERIRVGREFAHASFEPVYYLIFHPRQILEVKRNMPAWTARLRNEGWHVRTFSVAEAILDILQQAPQRRFWMTADSRAPQAWERTNQALANALSNGALQSRLAAVLEELSTDPPGPNPILLLTDVEGLHPYMRIGTIEGQLAGQFHVPTVIFYPGVRTGKTRLKFLGFYPEDGNYRSVHVGG